MYSAQIFKRHTQTHIFLPFFKLELFLHSWFLSMCFFGCQFYFSYILITFAPAKIQSSFSCNFVKAWKISNSWPDDVVAEEVIEEAGRQEKKSSQGEKNSREKEIQ